MEYNIDAEDAGVLSSYLLGMLVLVGIATVELFGATMSDQLFTLADGTVGITIAGLLVVSTWAFVYLTNSDSSIPSLEDQYGQIVAASLIVTVAIVFSPDVSSWVADQHDLIRLAIPVIGTAGLGAVGYLR
jgi:hypothetical protein